MPRQFLSVDEALEKAKQLANAGDANAAGQLYQQILSRQPKNKKAKKALKALQEGASISDQQSIAHSDLQKLMRLYEAEKLDQALSLAQQLSRKHAEQPLPFNIAGVILARRNDHEGAVAKYERALELAPNYADAYSNLASSLRKLGHLEQAKRNYMQAIQLNPRDPDNYFDLGILLQNEGEFDQAAASYQRAIKLRPLHYPSHIHLGNTMRMMGKPDEAIDSYRNALAIDSEQMGARINIGIALLSQKDYESAITWLQETLELEPKDSRVHLQLGKARLLSGMREEAITSFKDCLKYDPESVEAKHFLKVAENKTTEAASPDYVRLHFDAFASSFEHQLKERLGYKAPEILRSLLDEHSEPSEQAELGVDLGCGTGLGGEALRDKCKTLVGIDLSGKMLELAEKKGVYDSLIVGDFSEAIPDLATPVDLFFCADALLYIGKLEKLFLTLSEQSRTGTLFAFSTEHDSGPDLELLPSGRYAHGKGYVERVAESAGFEMLSFHEAPLRMESGDWLTGGYYLLRYRGTE